MLCSSFASGRETVTTAGAGHVVGDPGPGEQGPGSSLQASNGETVELTDYEGKSVLLYFQVGIGCHPSWDQIRDLEKESPAVDAAGIEEILSLTTSPLDLVTRKDVVRRVQRDQPLMLEEVHLHSERGRALAEEHDVLFVPGILLDGAAFGHDRLSERKLRRALR